MKFLNELKNIKRETLIKNSFLLPILLVVLISLSHVVSWYDLGNPFAWAIYLSVSIEIFALASVSAASININRASVWFLFSIVTSIQIIGNVFFEFQDIDQNGILFKSWMELVQPFFNEDWTPLDHRRLLAIMQGASIPMMSLIALNYYIKFGDKLREKEQDIKNEEPKAEESKIQEPINEETPIEKDPVVEKILNYSSKFSKPEEKPLPDLLNEVIIEKKKKDDDEGLNPAYGVHHE